MKLYDRKSGYSSCVYVSTNTQFVGIHRLILRNKLIFHLQPLNEVGCVSVFMQVGLYGSYWHDRARRRNNRDQPSALKSLLTNAPAPVYHRIHSFLLISIFHSHSHSHVHTVRRSLYRIPWHANSSNLPFYTVRWWVYVTSALVLYFLKKWILSDLPHRQPLLPA